MSSTIFKFKSGKAKSTQIRDLFKIFKFKNGKAKSTLMSSTIKLDKDEKGKKVDVKHIEV